mmetsp:Transcript_9244/g.16752  ORF Transcript_9244/g.16752 Transcript_9244/m.16752 type:complete len:207 (+) Transcript_9244:324-944(+)
MKQHRFRVITNRPTSSLVRCNKVQFSAPGKMAMKKGNVNLQVTVQVNLDRGMLQLRKTIFVPILRQMYLQATTRNRATTLTMEVKDPKYERCLVLRALTTTMKAMVKTRMNHRQKMKRHMMTFQSKLLSFLEMRSWRTGFVQSSRRRTKKSLLLGKSTNKSEKRSGVNGDKPGESFERISIKLQMVLVRILNPSRQDSAPKMRLLA